MRLAFFLMVCTSILMSCGGEASRNYKTIPTEGYEKKPMNRRINKKFPFDIDVRVSENKIANTKAIFGNRKKPVVLSFWLTTCVYCTAKFKALSKEYDNMKSEVDFDYYGISIDYEDQAANVFPLAEENGWPFPILHDINREFRRTLPGGLNGIPQTFVYDKNGKLIFHQNKGETINFQKLVEILKGASK